MLQGYIKDIMVLMHHTFWALNICNTWNYEKLAMVIIVAAHWNK
jgi:hypothetical protein